MNRSPLNNFFQDLQNGFEGDRVVLVADHAKLSQIHDSSPSPSESLALLQTYNIFTNPERSFLSRTPKSCRWSGHFTPAAGKISSPSQPSRKSRWGGEAVMSPVGGRPSLSPKKCCQQSPEVPRRLPEHTDSFRIHKRKFQRRGGFIMSTLQLDSLRHLDDETASMTDSAAHDEEFTEVIQALLEIESECNRKCLGGEEIRVPDTMKSFPCSSTTLLPERQVQTPAGSTTAACSSASTTYAILDECCSLVNRGSSPGDDFPISQPAGQ